MQKILSIKQTQKRLYVVYNKNKQGVVVAQAFNPSTQEAERQVNLYEFKVSLVSRVNFKTVRVT